jgi:hypothetical protein
MRQIHNSHETKNQGKAAGHDEQQSRECCSIEELKYRH